MKKLFYLVISLLIVSCSALQKKDKNTFEGYFSYMADAAMFIDCKTDERFSVSNEGEYLSIEKEYLRIVENAGDKVFISFTGKIRDKNPNEEGNRKKIIINKLLNIQPDKKCN